LKAVEIERSGTVRAPFWAIAQGAAACVGLLLLGGTVFWQLLESGPAFPPHLMMPAEVLTDDAGDTTVLGEAPTTRRTTRRAAAEAWVDPKVLPPMVLDINRADGDALQGLPGVGPTLARRIVAYREAHGQFRRVEELMEVPGIGAKRYARFQRWVRAEGP
jgi:competence ComEA-like helix-hairpin-helix protein